MAGMDPELRADEASLALVFAQVGDDNLGNAQCLGCRPEAVTVRRAERDEGAAGIDPFLPLTRQECEGAPPGFTSIQTTTNSLSVIHLVFSQALERLLR